MNETNHYCLNTIIVYKKSIKLNFIARDAMNISSLGSKTIELLFENKIINVFQLI